MTHAILQITKGVAKTPGDSRSSELGLTSVDLLDGGFNVESYDIKLPALKSSAVWADSPLSDGRRLQSGTLGNPVETLRIELTAGTFVQMAAKLTQLTRMKQDCNDYWDTNMQLEPVYIKHQIVGEPGARYALLYDIDLAIDEPMNPGDPNRLITMVIEREYGWRGIAPGANPKRWAIENVFSNQKFNNTNAPLLLGTDFLVYETGIENRAEVRTDGAGYSVKNFVDIPAEKIPGDLPALLCFSYTKAGNSNATSLFVSKTTARNTGNVDRVDGSNQFIIHAFNAADASVATDTTLAADTGANTGISGLQRRSQTTFATATLISRLGWGEGNYSVNGLNLSVLRGTYAVFARARLSAASTTVQLQLNVGEVGSAVSPLSPVTFTGEGVPSGTGNTSFWELVYLGQVTMPLTNRKTVVSVNGMGIAVHPSSTSADIGIELYASRTAGAGVLYVNDLLFMPTAEGAMTFVSTGQGLTSNGGGLLYDNTGYLQHGDNEEYAALFTSILGSQFSEYDRLQMTGQSIYLTPGVDNRLEFLAYTDSNKRSAYNIPTGVTIRVSIVPRWSSYRTE